MLGVHVPLEVRKVGVLLAADFADAELLFVVRRVGHATALVATQLLRPREAPIAKLAEVRPLAGVCGAHVFPQRRRVDELLRTHVARVRRVPAVSQHVRLQVPTLVEAALAHRTLKRPDPRVLGHVFAQSVGSGVRAVTQLAAVGTLAVVAAKMLLEVTEFGERLGAHVAGVSPVVGVAAHVSLQVGRVRKLLGAHGAGEPLTSGRVHPHYVVLQVRFGGECSLAQIARQLQNHKTFHKHTVKCTVVFFLLYFVFFLT